jgi:hypothetical protein
MPTFEVKVIGVEGLIKKLDSSLIAAPMQNFLQKSAVTVESKTKENTPVDTGRLRSSITHSMDTATVPLWAKVGTNIKYAPFVELGTRPHFPPIDALRSWASKHGFANAYVICLAISRHGTKAAHMLQRAIDSSLNTIEGYRKRMMEEIRGNWGK